jgi:hypothetical protein
VLASAVGIVILTHQEAVISERWSPPFLCYIGAMKIFIFA